MCACVLQELKTGEGGGGGLKNFHDFCFVPVHIMGLSGLLLLLLLLYVMPFYLGLVMSTTRIDNG